MKRVLVLLFLSIFVFLTSFEVSKIDAMHDSTDNRLIIVTHHENINVDDYKSKSENYKNVDIIVLESDEIDHFEMNENDLLAVDILLLTNSQVKSLVCDRLQSNYVVFLGDSDVNTLEAQLGLNFTQRNQVYSTKDDNLISNSLVEMCNNTFSMLKYTENDYLKSNIEYVDLNNTNNFENFIVPCLDILVESNGIQTYVTANTSGSHKVYLYNKNTGEQLSSYFQTNYKIYKETNETSSKYDYFVFETISYFSTGAKGHYALISHSISSDINALSLDAVPRSDSDGRTS